MAQHRTRKTRHTMRWVLLGVGLFLVLMHWHGSNVQDAQHEPIATPSVTSKGTVDEPMWDMATDTLYVCTEEDGSAPGQPFPCLWQGSAEGNTEGTTYVLTHAPGIYPV
jgi:hypothetical protein